MTDTQVSEVSGVLMVGSAPYASAEETFRAAMEHLSGHLTRLPDGEVGERDTWIRWQYKRIGQSPQMRQQDADNVYVPFPPYEIVDGVMSPDEIEFPNLGYGDAAIESYGTFSRLAEEGVIPAGVRFQVGLPAPLAVATFYVAKEHREMFEQAYGRALGREFEKMAAAIPPEKLAIQWEVVSEFALLEGIVENHLGDDLLGEINRRVARLVDLVPQPMEAGIHLCYGDSGHKHFVEPKDTGHLVDVANGVSALARRPIGWIHLPVPKERDDDAYYEPLRNLSLKPGTELYLGLVHHTGGVEGTRARVAAAKKHVARFGVATECGFGRRPVETMPDVYATHTAMVEEG